ncbi:MAG: protein-(glutamine-N5) methyltransferase, release factor-specific [Methylomonas sp.]|nr:MAG: protein-(glutamine-N5) methyltransferase, release factor-specific [Methylomonas sp.]
MVERRAQGWPVAYLTGKREFWSRQFAVDSNVLIPRPDTELLIELSLNCLAKAPANILDLGTGSGIIAITLAAERPHWTVLATDTNPASLTVAQNNAIALNTANVRFRQSDWFSAIDETGFDLIVSNPPYIDATDSHLTTGDVRFEPRLALVSPEHGLYDIALIVSQARNHLKPGGHLLIEHGYNQGDDVKHLFEQSNYHSVSTHLDLAGNPRVTSGTWTPT